MPLEDEDFLRDSLLAVLEKTFVSVMDGSVFFSVFFSDRLVSLPAKNIQREFEANQTSLNPYIPDGLFHQVWMVCYT